jgi:hypothetical protein
LREEVEVGPHHAAPAGYDAQVGKGWPERSKRENDRESEATHGNLLWLTAIL